MGGGSDTARQWVTDIERHGLATGQRREQGLTNNEGIPGIYLGGRAQISSETATNGAA